MLLAERLKEIRKSAELTQSQLAEVMGVGLPRVRNIENRSASSLAESEILNLKNRLNISVEWLVLGKGEMFNAGSSGTGSDEYITNEEELIKQIVLMVETKLQKEDKEMLPEAKANLIANLFVDCRSLVGEEIDEKVISILKYVS